jgi:ATP-dependent protease ClpP protease subunit
MIYINFNAMVSEKTSQVLMSFVTEQIRKGEKEIYVLLSSQGGSVMHGITLYNFFRSLECKVTMHNIGIVDSIANVVFLAGSERYAVANSSFLFHGVAHGIANANLGEKDLNELLVSLRRDQQLIGEIIAKNSKLQLEKVKSMFLEAKTLTPEEAKAQGMIQDIKDVKIPVGANVTSFVF